MNEIATRNLRPRPRVDWRPRAMAGRPRTSRWFLLALSVNWFVHGICAFAAENVALRNWFDDPFFQVRNGAAACPLPLGPLTTETEMRKQTHYRSERGTRCWLAGECRLPNSYMYDAQIADGVRSRFESTRAWRDATLWVTVQRRIVWVEGCVAPAYRGEAQKSLEALVRKVPDVELVVVNVWRGGSQPIPYRTLQGAR